jgi:MSHA biogenesis protein MshI
MLLESLFGRKRIPGLTGLGLHADGVCLARIEHQDGRRPLLAEFDFRPWEEAGAAQEKTLARLAADHGLKRASCTTVLDQSNYSLLLTEAPDVPPDELRAAMRWRVKDLIDFPVNDATLDVFDVPGAQAAGRARQVYAVAARTAAIRKRADLMHAAGINLEAIDIAELAQRNLAALLPEDVRGVALLSFADGSGLLTLTRQGELYLSRNLDTGLDAMLAGSEPAAHFDRIVLEVQRSLDYYDSHFRQPPVAGLVLAPTDRPVPGLEEHLRANLNVSVSIMDLAQLLDTRAELAPGAPARCLLTIGAALRREEAAP